MRIKKDVLKNKDKLSKLLVSYRGKRGYTQRFVAEELELSVVSVWKHESGSAFPSELALNGYGELYGRGFRKELRGLLA